MTGWLLPEDELQLGRTDICPSCRREECRDPDFCADEMEEEQGWGPCVECGGFADECVCMNLNKKEPTQEGATP